jgi:plastocyanin
MSKTVTGIIVTVLAVAALFGIVVANKQDEPAAMTSTSNSHTAGDDHGAGDNHEPSPTNEVQSGNVKAEIKDFAFSPKTLKIKKGATVTWTNRDSAKHDIDPDNESPDFKESELLAQGESYSFTFNTVGTYTYHCSPHPYMKATVEVVE